MSETPRTPQGSIDAPISGQLRTPTVRRQPETPQVIDEEVSLAKSIQQTNRVALKDSPLSSSRGLNTSAPSVAGHAYAQSHESEVFYAAKSTLELPFNRESKSILTEKSEDIVLTREEYERLLANQRSLMNLHNAEFKKEQQEENELGEKYRKISENVRTISADSGEFVGNAELEVPTVEITRAMTPIVTIEKLKDHSSDEGQKDNSLSPIKQIQQQLLQKQQQQEEEKEKVVTDVNSPSPVKREGLVRSISADLEERISSINVTPKKQIQPSIQSPERAMETHTPTRKLSPMKPLMFTEPPASESNVVRQSSVSASPRVLSPIRVPNEPVVSAPSPMKFVESPIKKFTLEDLEAARKEAEDKSSRQIEFLQYEIHGLQEKYENSLQTNAELRSMLAEYERTLAQFIDARRNRPDQHSTTDQLIQEKKRLELEIQTLQISFQNLHQRYEDLKGLHDQSRNQEATLKKSVTLLQQEVANLTRTHESVKKSYEEKLESVNMEMMSVKGSLENELSATKAKLLKSELKISSLDSAIESKTRENSELMTICDELIKKMDKNGSK